MKKTFLTLVLLLLFSCDKNTPLEYEIKDISKSFPSDQSDEAIICFTFPELKNKSNDDSIEKINHFIRTLLNDSKGGEIELKPLQTIQQNFIEEYSKFKNEFPDSYQKWSIEKKIEVNYNKNNLFGITFNDYSYLGGAHPNTFISYFYFDLSTGKKLELNDFVNVEKLSELNKLAERKFRHQKNYNVNSNYEEDGYFVKNGQFQLNSNFLITDEGFIFLFNSYEIAAYAVGRTTIKLNIAELKDFMKNDSFFNF